MIKLDSKHNCGLRPASGTSPTKFVYMMACVDLDLRYDQVNLRTLCFYVEKYLNNGLSEIVLYESLLFGTNCQLNDR